MGLIKEPLEIDFEFTPKLLSIEEKQRISDYIKAYKTAKREKSDLKGKKKRIRNGKSVIL